MNNSKLIKTDYIIIGSGLSGLTIANILSKNGLKTIVVDKGIKAGGRMSHGVMNRSKVGGNDFKYDHARSINIKQVRKDNMMSEPQMKIAKNRMKWYKDRDEDKIKTDEAKNNFESLVYQFRSWLREEENEVYVEEE